MSSPRRTTDAWLRTSNRPGAICAHVGDRPGTVHGPCGDTAGTYPADRPGTGRLRPVGRPGLGHHRPSGLAVPVGDRRRCRHVCRPMGGRSRCPWHRPGPVAGRRRRPRRRRGRRWARRQLGASRPVGLVASRAGDGRLAAGRHRRPVGPEVASLGDGRSRSFGRLDGRPVLVHRVVSLVTDRRPGRRDPVGVALPRPAPIRGCETGSVRPASCVSGGAVSTTHPTAICGS